MFGVDLMKRDTAIPFPFEAQTTGRWDGDDGSWSTFAISVGTPPQSFRVLPATIDPVITVPSIYGCEGGVAGLEDCGDRRGVNYFNGKVSRGFDDTNSTTWTLFNVYEIFTGQSLYNDTGQFGNDTVTIGGQHSSKTVTMPQQVVAEISAVEYWLGSFGLGAAMTNYNQNSFKAPSLISNMKSQGIIPSMSYAYTAGQHYNNITGSLIFGGWDTNKMSPSNMTTKIQGTNTTQQYLNVNVQSILAQHTVTGGTAALLSGSGPIVASIDSSVNQLFLPQAACDTLSNAFGLSYDAEKDWYLINDTMHDTLRSKNPTLTFVLGGDSGTTNIVMAYNSLDMQIGIPWYNSSVNYFPLKRSPNDSQIILGRTFLQETYLVVDWEQSSLTVGQVINATAPNIQPITPSPVVTTSAAPATSSAIASDQSSGGGIGAGAIAGIVVGILVIAALGALFFWQRRRPKNQRWSILKKSSDPPPAYDNGAEWYGDKPVEERMSDSKEPKEQIMELDDSSKPRAELTSDNVRRLEEMVQQRELMSTPVAELVGDAGGSELEITSNTGRDSLASGSITARTSVASPRRTSAMSPERARSPLGSPPLASPPLGSPSLFELE